MYLVINSLLLQIDNMSPKKTRKEAIAGAKTPKMEKNSIVCFVTTKLIKMVGQVISFIASDGKRNTRRIVSVLHFID